MPTFDTLGRKGRSSTIDLSQRTTALPGGQPPLDLRPDSSTTQKVAVTPDARDFYEFMTDIHPAPALIAPTVVKADTAGDADRKWWLALALVSLALLAGILVYAANREYGANGTGNAGRGNGSMMSGFGGILPGTGGTDKNPSTSTSPSPKASPSATSRPAATATPWPSQATQAGSGNSVAAPVVTPAPAATPVPATPTATPRPCTVNLLEICI